MVFLEHVLLALAMRRQGDEVTTRQVGDLLGVSQQTASRYLRDLEGGGFIQRVKSGRGFNIRITSSGLLVLRQVHSDLGRFFGSEIRQSYNGIIVSGIGEGAYYIREYSERIEKAVGYRPYLGTLNVRVEGGRPSLDSPDTVDIEGFISGTRTFGRVSLTPIKLHVRKQSIVCHVIIPERTHHTKDVELIARNNLRMKYGLADGDKATITID